MLSEVMLTIPCLTRPDTVDALHANFIYGATASNAPIPAGYAVFDNNSNIPFGIYGTWSAAHSRSTRSSRNLVPRPDHKLVSGRTHSASRLHSQSPAADDM